MARVHFDPDGWPSVYASVIELTKERPLSKPEIVERLPEPAPSILTLRDRLRHWAKAGALRTVSLPRETQGKPYNGYQSTAMAFSPGVLRKALGKQAIALLPSEAIGAAVEVAANEPELVERGWAREPVRTWDAQTQAPAYYFECKMTPDGALISYDEYFRVIALLKRLSEAQA